MSCELCGSKSEELHLVIFSGSRVLACPSCVRKYGLVVIRRAGEPRKKPIARQARQQRSVKPLSPEYDVVEDYGLIIKGAREARGLTQEDLARLVGVKLSYIRKVEQGKMVPELPVLRKLEKLLSVKLVEEAEPREEKVIYSSGGEDSITLGDLLGREEQ